MWERVKSPIRGVTTSHGDGIWKSTDGGKSWTHVGLESSGQIAKIEIHPNDADTAFVAVQGQIWGPNEERGVFRTTDGGKSWKHVLKVGPETGATDLCDGPDQPAHSVCRHVESWPQALVHQVRRHRRRHLQIQRRWRQLEKARPAACRRWSEKSPWTFQPATPTAFTLLIEAEPEKGGLWRSDDAGETWKLINGHRVLHSRAWYYIHIAADPVDEDTVYVLNVPLMKSIDGGKYLGKNDYTPRRSPRPMDQPG